MALSSKISSKLLSKDSGISYQLSAIREGSGNRQQGNRKQGTVKE
jgi:hypothetical protein